MFLYGAGGHCRAIVEILQVSKVAVHAIFDDKPVSNTLEGIPILDTSVLAIKKNSKWVIAIGSNTIRKKIVQRLNAKYSQISHKHSIVSHSSSIGAGSVVMAGVIINANSHIGEHCIINTGVIIEHDCNIRDFAHLAPRTIIAGNVEIGEGTFIGINSSVIPGVKIGKWVVAGAGSVIIEDIPDYAIVVGAPAKIIRFQNH